MTAPVDPLTHEELQHILGTMNAFGSTSCPVCASARKKLEHMINDPEVRVIAGHEVIITHEKKDKT
jgi:hypothetical protein